MTTGPDGRAGGSFGALLDVTGLRVHFRTPDGVVKAVDDVTFSVARGETLGVVGESGSGKSVTFMTVMGLVNRSYAAVSGEVRFLGRDLLTIDAEDLRKIRGDQIGMVFQDPMTSLHPMYRVGDQIIEAIRAHRDVSKDVARRETVDMLGLVGIPSPAERAESFPHQLSGGMRQRVMIAMALVLKPDLLIADEPTTALDVTVQAQIIQLMKQLNRELGTAMMLITHNMALVASLCQRVVVMYAGRVVEEGPVEQIFDSPQHPYTWSLLRSVPRVDEARKDRLVSIRGLPPDLTNPPPGCKFHPRCPFVIDKCRTDPEPQLEDVAASQVARCWVLMRNVKAEDIDAAKGSVVSVEAAEKLKAAAAAPAVEVGGNAGS